MIRGLAVVAVGGALLSAVCIGASGAGNLAHWHAPMQWNVNWGDDDGPALRLTGHEPVIDRDLPWAGGEKLSFDLPATVTYTQGPVAKITLTGPDALVQHVVLRHDDLSLDRSVRGVTVHDALKIAITGPALHDFQIDSALSLDIENLSTDELKVSIDGAGKVAAHGSARSFKLEIDGAADADFGGLTVTDGRIEIDGLGHVVAGPSGMADVQIDGAGKVTLTKRPAQLKQEIDGAGSVTQPPGPAGQAL